MLAVRRASERGHAKRDWLESWHTFSFADYYDPRFMGFRSLRVINQDIVAPNSGFPPHSHKDMEIITYVMRGEVKHQDSIGNEGIIRPGEIQIMSAGTGVVHSEVNPSKRDELELLQIWILPKSKNLPPRYDQHSFAAEEVQGKLKLLLSPDKRLESGLIHQNVSLYVLSLSLGQGLEHKLEPGRHAWIQVVKGHVSIAGEELSGGDGLAVSEMPVLTFQALEAAELLVFDLG